MLGPGTAPAVTMRGERMSTSQPTTGDQVCQKYGLAPSEFAALSAAERALFRAAYAADELQVVEVPRGSNHGPDVDRYLIAAGAEPGEPWCAAFWTCMLLDSGVGRSELPELAASVHGWLDWAKHKGVAQSNPDRAYAGLIIETPTTGHLVAITSVNGNRVSTIEGNTNKGGSREGYGVFRRTRPISQFRCFVDCSSLK